MSVLPDTQFGSRARARLEHEQLIWLTTTAADGTPHPNPVWFLWEPDTESVLIYNANEAKRLTHIALRPRVALNFETADDGEDVVVFAGVAEQALDAPATIDHEQYSTKYGEGIIRIGSDPERFAQDYSVAVRVRLTRVRGF